jgi:hypothetical protein
MRQNLRKIILAAAFCSLVATTAYAETRLCPSPHPLKEGQDDLTIKEEEFTAENFFSSLSYLQKDLPKELLDKDMNAVKDRLDSSFFWIGYENSLKLIEGYSLKQAALLQIKQLQVSPKAKRKDDAVKRFCKFVGSTRYAD